MAKFSLVQVLEQCKISPPSISSPPTSLPLTFLDIPWLFFPPSKPLFFYHYPGSSSHFVSTTLPNLKRSLFLALQHFFPFAGTLTFPPGSDKPSLTYAQGNHVLLTIAESHSDFSYFISDHPQNAHEFYPLVPELPTRVFFDLQSLPLLAVQVTIFPNNGVCIGLAYHHVIADARTFNNFIKAWALFCGNPSSSLRSLPSFDRTAIKDARGLEKILVKELWKRKSSQEMVIGNGDNVDFQDKVRATFLMSPTHMARIKKWVIARCKKKNIPQPVHLSPYVLTCAFVWVCLVKAKSDQSVNDSLGEDPNYFGFIAGGLARVNFSVPDTYFGNCVGFGRSMALRNELMGEDGIIVAANALGNKIKKLDKEILDGAEKWISDWEVLLGSDIHVVACGSPKVDLYETDFGWGRPIKIVDISIDCMRSGISLTESRTPEGGIEIGLSLPRTQMDGFRSLFDAGLQILK